MKRRSILTMNDKKAVSAIVGYVLVVTFGIIMAAIVYNYLKTYVPKDAVKCPDGVSIFLKDYSYDCDTGELNLTLKNNGKFNFAGYYIHGANDSTQKVATINLVNNFTNSSNGEGRAQAGSYVMFSARTDNIMTPKIDIDHYFNTSPIKIEVIEITPVRFEKVGTTVRFASCGDANIREEINCNA